MQSIANNSGSRRPFCHSRVVFPCYLSHQPDECIMIPLYLLCLDPMSASWFRSLGQLLLFFFSRGKFSTKFCQITWVSTSFRQSSDKCFFFGVFGWWGHCHQRPWKVSWSWSKLAKRRLAKMWILCFRRKFHAQGATLNWRSCLDECEKCCLECGSQTISHWSLKTDSFLVYSALKIPFNCWKSTWNSHILE